MSQLGQVFVGRAGTHQSVAYTTVAGTIATAVATGTNRVRVVLTTTGFILISSATDAAVTDVYMVANIPEVFTINPGEKVSAIRSAVNGTLHVTEIQ